LTVGLARPLGFHEFVEHRCAHAQFLGGGLALLFVLNRRQSCQSFDLSINIVTTVLGAILLGLLDLLGDIIFGPRLMEAMVADAVLRIEQHAGNLVRGFALLEQLMDDVPDGARAIAAEIGAAAVLNQCVEIVFLFCLFVLTGLVLFLLAIELSDNAVENFVDLDELRCIADLQPGNGDEMIGFPVHLHTKPVGAGHIEFAVQRPTPG